MNDARHSSTALHQATPVEIKPTSSTPPHPAKAQALPTRTRRVSAAQLSSEGECTSYFRYPCTEAEASQGKTDNFFVKYLCQCSTDPRRTALLIIYATRAHG